VVAAFALEIPFSKGTITIVPTEHSSGYFSLESIMKRSRPDVDSSDRARIRAEKNIILCLAGMEAQRRHRASSVRSHHAGSDYAAAVDLASYFVGGSEVLPLYMKYLRARAKSLFDQSRHWEAVGAVAGELVDKRTLSGDDALKVIRNSFAKALAERSAQRSTRAVL
jgi:hypothetical protein